MTATRPPLAATLSATLRAATREAHEAAENAPFVRDLVAGRLPVAAYTALAVQNHAIYRALEGVTPAWADHPVAGPFVLAELMRLAALERDLGVLLGPGWASAVAALVQPATIAYVERLRTAAATSAPAFVAHHYVRYLGDLSGGQILRRRLVELYGAAGSSFYVFDAVPRVKPFRDAYRARLDALDLPADERAGLVAEAVTAFELNRAVFADLAAWTADGRRPA